LNGNVSWDVAHTTTGNWSLFVAERYVTQQYWDLLDSPGGTMNPYATTDARLTFDFAKYPLSISLYGKNLTDKEYFLTKADIPAFGYTYDHVGNPRTFGVNLHYTF
jgi:iron complex outermembrane recepter protein